MTRPNPAAGEISAALSREQGRDSALTDAPPRAERRAELVCRRKGGRPGVFAVIHPAQGRELVHAAGALFIVGEDFNALCPCGDWHHVDGARLRSALVPLRPRSGRVPTVDVAQLLRTDLDSTGP